MIDREAMAQAIWGSPARESDKRWEDAGAGAHTHFRRRGAEVATLYERLVTPRGRWYPEMPPALPGETSYEYTDRLTGADKTGRRPYDHRRNRQCSIGCHDECTDKSGHSCECPCHEVVP